MLYLNSYHKLSMIRSFKRDYYEKKHRELVEKNKHARILVVLHLFYPDSWGEIEEYLRNLRVYKWDLLVTYPFELEDKLELERVKAFKSDVRFAKFPNKGYDIGPFIQALKTVELNDYDIVFKLQSKGVKRKLIYIYEQAFFGRDWFVNLFEGVLGAKVIHSVIDALLNENQTGAICAKNLIVHDPLYKEHLVKKGLEERNLSFINSYFFIAGTCFGIKSHLLKPYQRMNYSSDEFDMIPRSRGMSLAHLLERHFAINIIENGFSILGNDVCNTSRFLKRPIQSILYRWSSERLLETNYHIDDEYFYWKLDNLLVRYKKREVCLRDLKYPSDIHKRNIPISECAPYLYLMGDKKPYEEYSLYHRENGFPLMSENRFNSLIHSMEKNGYNDKNIIIVDDRNVIADGQHRACYLAYKNGLDYKVNVLQINRINKKELVKMITPEIIKKWYYLRKYGTY